MHKKSKWLIWHQLCWQLNTAMLFIVIADATVWYALRGTLEFISKESCLNRNVLQVFFTQTHSFPKKIFQMSSGFSTLNTLINGVLASGHISCSLPESMTFFFSIMVLISLTSANFCVYLPRLIIMIGWCTYPNYITFAFSKFYIFIFSLGVFYKLPKIKASIT